MQRIKFEYDKTFGIVDDRIVSEGFKEGIKVLEFLDKLKDEIKKTLDNDDDMELKFETLDFISDNLEVLSSSSFRSLCLQMVAKSPVLLKRLMEMKGNEILDVGAWKLDDLEEDLREFNACYALPTGEPMKEFNDSLKSFIGNMAYYLYYQFDLQLLEIDAEMISEPVYQYCESTGCNPKTLQREMRGVLNRNMPTLEVFDEHPELEEPVLELIAPYLSSFDLFSNLLTLEDIQELVKQNADIKAILDAVAAREQVVSNE